MADYEDTKVNNLVINNMSQEKFEELKAAGELDPTQIYCTPEEGGGASLPDQTDNAGKFLTTDGTTASWGSAIKNGGDSVTGTYVFSKIKMEVEENVTSGGIVFKTTTHGLKICGLQGHIVGLNLYGNVIYNLKALYASDNTTSGRLVVPTEGGTLARIEDIDAIGGDGTTGQVLTKTDDGFAWQDSTGGTGGASLPDQTGNAGKFLMTNGTEVSWGDALKNNSSDLYGTAIGTYSSAVIGGTAVGNSSKVYGYYGTAIGALAKILNSGSGNGGISIGYAAEANKGTILLNASGKAQQNRVDGTFVVATSAGTFTVTDANGNVPRERLKNLVEVLPTEDNGYTTVKNYGNGYVEITGYTAIGTVGAGTGSEVQIDLPAGYTMADINYWVNIAPTSETTMFDFKAEAKARSTTHFMVAYKNEDTTTGLTAAGVYWEVHGMLATE